MWNDNVEPFFVELQRSKNKSHNIILKQCKLQVLERYSYKQRYTDLNIKIDPLLKHVYAMKYLLKLR